MSMSHIIQDRRARSNGAPVQVIDARQCGDFDENEGGRWVTFCGRHETFVQHATRKDAMWHAPDPEGWCGMCAEGMA